MASMDLTALEKDLFGDLSDEPLPLPPRPQNSGSQSVKTHGRRVSNSARARYESSVRQAVEQKEGTTIRVRSHRGWLEKQGGLIPNWKRRYFVFEPTSSILSYFTDETCTTKKGEFEIPSSDLDRIVVHDKEGKHTFVITCVGRQLRCRASSIDDASTWMACLDNNFFITSLRAEVEVRMELLKTGCVFEKHGRKGQPHQRMVWLADDEQRLCWSKTETSKKITKDAFLYLEAISAIKRGRTTKVFQRKSGGQFRNAPDSQCFSLITSHGAGRTLDLVAPDTQTALGWIGGLSYLTLYTRCIKEKITKTGRWTIKPASSSASTSASTSPSAVHGETEENMQKLNKRGKKLDELNDASDNLVNDASSFAEHCAQLNQMQGSGKGWF